jgi:hypothetical protein
MFASTQLIVTVIQYGFREIENETEGDERMEQKYKNYIEKNKRNLG